MLRLEAVDAFYAKAQVLHALSLEVRAGEVVALLGRNSAGKTTTLKTAMQILPPRRGRVVFDGVDITGCPAWQVARLGLGYVPEERRIFGRLSVRENLAVGRQPPRGGAPVWNEDILFELFPNLAERADAPGRSLSGGEQQMLTIARTLMGNPRIVLLDEPSEGIAPVIVAQMADTIARLKAEGLAVLLSEQHLGLARRLSDRAVILESGRAVFEGSFDALDAAPETRDRYLAV